MKIYVIVSDQHNHLLSMYSLFFNKYWKNQEVTFLCYKIPKIVLPENFQIISIGKQSKTLEPVINYFKEVSKEDYFIMLLEDLFLVDYIDNEKVKRLEYEIQNGADKASLHFYFEGEALNPNNSIIELKQNVRYRTSVQAAIWTKKYLLQHLKPEHNWWSFETQHKLTMNDNAKIVFLKEQKAPNCIFDAINIYEKGKLTIEDFKVKTDLSGNGLTHEEDIVILKQLLRINNVSY